jgi:tetratricopeptide (TPR) repeat protein
MGAALSSLAQEAALDSYGEKIQAAKAALKSGDYAAAQAKSLAASREDESRWEAFALLASSYSATERYGEAVIALEKAITRAPENKKPGLESALRTARSKVLSAVGAKALSQKNYAEAAKKLSAAAEISGDPLVILDAAKATMLAGNYAKADGLLKRVEASGQADLSDKAATLRSQMEALKDTEAKASAAKAAASKASSAIVASDAAKRNQQMRYVGMWSQISSSERGRVKTEGALEIFLNANGKLAARGHFMLDRDVGDGDLRRELGDVTGCTPEVQPAIVYKHPAIDYNVTIKNGLILYGNFTSGIWRGRDWSAMGQRSASSTYAQIMDDGTMDLTSPGMFSSRLRRVVKQQPAAPPSQSKRKR